MTHTTHAHTPPSAPSAVRWIAIAGTAGLIGLAFWTSFTAQADVARRAGVDPSQAWVWPIILDGLIVVATVAGLAVRHDDTARRYAWTLVWVAATLSTTGNVLHHVMPDPAHPAAVTGMPMAVGVAVACIPPVALLAITHLTLLLTRRRPDDDASAANAPAEADLDVSTSAPETADNASDVPAREIDQPMADRPTSPALTAAAMTAFLLDWRASHDGVDPTYADAGAHFDKPTRTAGRWLREAITDLGARERVLS